MRGSDQSPQARDRPRPVPRSQWNEDLGWDEDSGLQLEADRRPT